MNDFLKQIEARFKRKGAYRAVFMGEGSELSGAGEEVIRDLSQFCYGFRTTASPGSTGFDPIAIAMAEGRRQVLLRILGKLRLDDASILEKLERNSHE